MIFINMTIMLGIPLILGLAILAWLKSKELALAFPLGLGFLTIIMFFMAIFRIPLTLGNISTGTIIISIILLILGRKQIKMWEIKKISWNFFGFQYTEIVLILLIFGKVLYTFFMSIIKPLIDVDAFQQYSIVAKGIFYRGTFLSPYLKQFMHDKPVFPFLIQGWNFLALNSINDALFKLTNPVLLLCLLIVFYCSVRRYSTRLYSLLFTFLLSTLPFLIFHVATAYADFYQTVYYSIATIYLFFFMKEFSNNKEKSYQDLLVSLIFLGLSVWMKRAGIFLVGINIFALFLFLLSNKNQFDLKKVVLPIIIFAIIIIPWLLIGQAETLIGTLGDIGQTTSTSQGVIQDKSNIVFGTIFNKLFLYADWHLLWFLFVFSIIIAYKRVPEKPIALLLTIIGLNIIALVIQFRFGNSFAWILDGTLLDRLVMYQTPIVLFYCAEVLRTANTVE